ncbi:MAG: type II toxin-antitoxin system RelE/ParE family toxin [Bacteroidales bacterium]|nr:type II toxin-antitoxin system RelE/ParE family toxin [Bacteroidales bacterium]
MKKKHYKIELSDEAEKDFDISYQYYNTENENVADNFYKHINQSFIQIQKFPATNPKVHEDVRKFVVKKFPFVIYYLLKEPIIRVIAIFHTSRNPEIWQERTVNESD